ncbi:MAG: DUF5683 domain-containing protein [Bacteroidota bacterium]|nr:DUF5683 domain-containing protein [Bacteroidota bacterium]
MSRYIAILFIFSCSAVFAQQKDTIRVGDTTQNKIANSKPTYSSARRASILSACLPGLGQAYNKKYWKIPIIYTGFVGFGYLFYSNNLKYNEYRNALIQSQQSSNGGYAIVNDINWSTTQLQSQKLIYKKRRDLGAIGMGIIYLLNIIDANVDGHLKTFDVSDDLSINVEPWQNLYSNYSEYKMSYGLSIKINFK